MWTEPLYAGGASQAATIIMISGIPMPGISLNHCSADLNADGVVNLLDVPVFIDFAYGGNPFAVDFNVDGAANLLDVAVFAGAIGAACP